MRRDSKHRHKLGLKKETLRALTGDQLARVAGGSLALTQASLQITTTGASLGGSAKCTYTD
jgi:hypothetical protein